MLCYSLLPVRFKDIFLIKNVKFCISVIEKTESSALKIVGSVVGSVGVLALFGVAVFFFMR